MMTPMDYILGRSRPLSSRGSVIVLRPRHPSDSAIISRPGTAKDDKKRPSSLTFSTVPNRPNLAEEEDTAIETPSARSIAITEGKDGVEIHLPDEDTHYYYLENTHIHGIHHIFEKNPTIRFIWITVLIVFAFLACYQIFNQFLMYTTTPVSTNIEAEYPVQINLPTIAICNNNQFRLTYLTGARVQNRRAKNRTLEIKGVNDSSTNVFDKALLNTWDMDAVKFLRNAAHWKSRMIMSCIYPNGTRCRITDFKAVWTLTGLCWAINADPMNPVMVTGAGPSHALKLLLNVERYERIESCTPKFRTSSLPGLKILIYNQTDIPTSALDGVNVPPGYTMDIPFRMQHRQKLAGINCVQEDEKYHKEKIEESHDARTCKIRKYLDEIERQCACSMKRAYDPNPKENLTFCTVMDYFDCVVPVLKWGYDGGFSSYQCLANCDEIDYIAWQDMNELPSNIFPKLIDSEDEEDESDVDDDDNIDDELYVDELGRNEHFRCEDNQILEDHQVNRIKREAHRAYEKQARYQEDILLRTKRLMSRMTQASEKIKSLRWGWRNEDFSGVYERLVNNTSCFGSMSSRHPDIFNSINNKAAKGEEKRAKMIVHLLNKKRFLKPESEFKTISDVKHVYETDSVNEILNQLNFIEEYIHQIYSLYDEDSYTETLTRRLERMDRILQLMGQYDDGKLQRKAWAEKMQARNMKHFFEEDFYEGWYNVITKDLDITVGKTVADLEEKLDKLKDITVNKSGLESGSLLLFGDTAQNHTRIFAEFLDEILECSFGEVRNTSIELASEFKKYMHEFQGAYTNLFKKELPEYLENFEFGPKFVKENFAVVNVFLHKMNVEHWKQTQTYTIWSLFCDVGGALGLFLGASLLTIIEIIWLFCRGFSQNKWCGGSKECEEKTNTEKDTVEVAEKLDRKEKAGKRKMTKIDEAPESDFALRLVTVSKMEMMNQFTRSGLDGFRRVGSRIRRPRSRRDSEDLGPEYEVMLPVMEPDENEDGKKKIRFRPAIIRKVPGLIRRSLRKKKPEEVVDEEGEEEMDLREIKPEFEESKNKSPNHSLSGSRRSVPSKEDTLIDMEKEPEGRKSPPSIKDTTIDLDEEPEKIKTRKSGSKSKSPPSSAKASPIPSFSPLPHFHSPESEVESPRNPSPSMLLEQPGDPMFKSATEGDEDSQKAQPPRGNSESDPHSERVPVPIISFPRPPEDSPPSERHTSL